MSVDETYIDHTHSTNINIDQRIRNLRDDIFSETGCSTSAGIESKKLCARVATSQSKPNGQRHVNESLLIHFVHDLQFRELPGIGWGSRQKMDEWKVTVHGELPDLPLVALHRQFGSNHG